MKHKKLYADKCFGLPVEQIKDYGELTPTQISQVFHHFGRSQDNNRFVYAVKKNGDLVTKRERLRPEWGD